MKEMVLPLHLPCTSTPSDVILPPGMVPPSALSVVISSMAPPDYETATKSQPAPPDYDTAVRNNGDDTKVTSEELAVETEGASATNAPSSKDGSDGGTQPDLNPQ